MILGVKYNRVSEAGWVLGNYTLSARDNASED